MDYLSRIDRSLGLEPEEKEEEKKYIEANSYLDRIDRSLAPQAQQEEESGFGSDLLHALFQGADQTTAMLGGTLMLAGGPDSSENIAAHYKNRNNPAYVEAYDQLLARNTAEREEHWNQDNYWKWLGSLGEWAYNATNDDKSLTYKIVEMLPNSVPTFGGGAIGGFAAAGLVAAGVVSAPVTAIVGAGFIVGMGLGTILTIVGEKALDNVEEFGGSLEDAGSIREVFNNPEFQEKAGREGLIKGAEIALVDALSFKLAGRLFTSSGKKLEKAIHDELTELGVNTAAQAAVRKAYSNPKLRAKLQDHIDDYLKSTYEVTDETVASIRRAADEFAKSQTFTNRVRRGAKAVGIESLGEGVGEFVGEYHATGEAKLSDAMFEAIAGLGQSAATVGAAKALSGVGTGAKKALEKISRAQVESVAQGENSGLDPADINAAQVDFNEVNTQTTNALNERLRSEGSATPNISAYEVVLGDNEIRENLDQIVEGLIEEGGYEQYNETLKGFAREVYGESVSIYIPIAPEDEALVQSAESIPPETSTVAQAANIPGEYITVYTDDGKPIRTKVVKESKSGAKTVLDEQGSEVILDKSPLKSTPPEKQADLPDTQSRLSGYAVGSLDRNGVTARPGSNVVRITVPVDDIISRGNQAKGQLVVRVDNLQRAELTPKRPIEKEEATVLSAAQKRESQIAQGEQLEKHEQEFDAGHREVEVEESKKTDPKKLRRAALRENERKIARFPEIEALREGKSTKTEDGKRVTTISLARVIKRNNVPTEKGRGEVTGTIDTRKRDVRDYLNALKKPDQLDAVNAVLKKRGAKLSRKNDELILTDNANNEFGLGTIRIQEYTVDEYLDFTEEQKTELAMDTQRATERKRERTQLSATVLREKKRKMPVGRVATNIRIIEDKFVTREKGITRIDEAGLDRYLENVTAAGEWKKSELSALDREVKRLRNEAEITERSRDASKPAPQHRVIAGTRPSPLAPGMGKVSRLTGRTLRKFHASASNILHKGTTDSLLGKIAGAYTKKKRVGAVGEEKVTPANILTLPSSADNDLVARVYSLASMLIYGQDSVTYSRPDSSLNLDSDSTSLGGYLKSNKVLNDSQFGKLNQEVQRLIGSGSTLIRISDFEYIIHNDSLGKSQLARRLGRLQAKFGNTYGFQTEFFVSKTETLAHNWAEDSLGTGIRNQIRELGFSDLLAFVDNRRDAFLELAQQYGANIEETKQQGIAFEQPPATGPPIPKRKIRASLKKGEYHRLKQTDYEALPDDIRAVVDQRLNQLEDPARARAALIANKNTPWAGQAIEGAITRVAMEMLIAGKTPTFPNIFDSTVKSGKPNPAIKRYLEAFKGGVEGVWLDLAQRHMIGHAAKPIHSVNSSFINCEPSLNCAKFCYATSGNYSYLPVILKGELSDWAVTNNPERAAELTAQEYSHTAEFYTNKALRIFDKGDGNSHYLKYIKALNDTVIDGKPIRVQVFSKHPEFLRQVPEMNVRLLSIDETNQQLALDNTDLGVSYVYTGSKSDIAFLEHNEERFTRHGGVILPVKLGRNTLDKKETAKLPKWVKKYTCPIDGGVKEIGIGKGKWNCTECDKGGGLGCYHGQTTKSILDIITEARREPYEKTLRETEIPLRELARQYAPDREADLVAELRSLIRLARKGADTVADAEYDATAGAESGEGQGLVPKGKVRASFAHHGTGADLKGRKFNLDFIGTGEGAQAYGWGIYFAELLNIGQFYAGSGARKLVYVDGVKADSQNPHHALSRHYKFALQEVRRRPNLIALRRARAGLSLSIKDYTDDDYHQAAIDETVEHYSNLVSGRPQWRTSRADGGPWSTKVQRVLKLAEEARANPSVIGKVTTEEVSNLYTVDIDEEFIDQMLDWDAKISDERAQPVNLMEAFEAFANSAGVEFNDESLEEWFDGHGMDFDGVDNVTGEALYRLAVRDGEGLPVLEEEYEGQFGDQQRASLWLLSRGIGGLKYLDNVSRKGSRDRFKLKVELDGVDVAAVPSGPRFNSAGKKIVKKKMSRFRRDGEMPKNLLRMRLIDAGVFKSFWEPKKGRRVSPNLGVRERFADHLTSFLLEYSRENEGVTRTTQEMLEAYQHFGATELAWAKRTSLMAWGSAVIESGRVKFEYTAVTPTRNFVIWEQEFLDTLNTAPPDVKASIPLKKPADGGFFLGRARSELNKKWGKKNIDSLEAQGIIKIISNVTELPADIQELYETHEGIHDETTGISYLIAENIREGEASGVLMHEVGTHFGLKRMVGNKAFAGILNDLLNRRTSDELAPYFAEVKDAYASLLKSGEMVEYSEDFLEEVLAKIAQDPKASNMGIIEEIYRRIRVFLSKHFEGIELKPADLQALTRGALKKSMKGRFRAESLEGSRVMAAIGDTDPQFQALVMNIIRRPDMAYRNFPANPTRKVSNRHKDAEFSSPLVEGHVNKKAKNKLWEATQALEAIFKDLNSDHTMDIDFSLDERAFAKSERVVRIRERKSGTMLVYRFGFEPIDKIKGLMLGPVVDFHNMGVFTKNEEYTLLQMKADFKKGVKLLKQGKLKKQHTLSLWANFRMGPKPPANYFIRHLKEDQTWDQFILVEELTDKQTVARIVMAEDIAIQNGYLPDGPVTPVQNPHGRYRYSLPSQSTNDLDAADKAVIQKATGKTEPGHVIQAYENFRSNPRLWFGQGVADRYLSIKNTLGNDGERAWKMMQLSDSADGLLHAVLQYGRPKEMVFNGEFDGYTLDENSKGLMTILEGLEGETDRFLTWMAGHRADQLSKPTAKHPEGREKFFTKDDIARMKKFGKGKTLSGKSRTLLFAQTMREIAKFQSDILDLAMKAGVISKTDRMSLLTDFYLPFYREFEKEGKTKTHIRGPAMNTDAVNLRDVIHGLQGSELKTNDLLHNLMMNWHSLLNASMKNRAGVAAVEAAVEAGVARLLDKKEAAQVSYGKSKSKTDKFKNMVYVMRDGEREWYEINDHFVLESLLQMNWQGPSGMFSTAMSHFKRMLTITVTASPAFKVRNLIRDTLHSVAVSDLNYNIFGNVKEGMTRASIHDPIYQRLIASGGAFHFGFLHDDPSSIRRILKYSNKGLPRNEAELKKQVLDTPGKALNFLRKGWDKYGEVGNRLENANRVALYLQRVDEIGHLEASFEARDLLNFAAGGSFPIVQYLTNGIAFLNARIVGTHKLIRSGTEKEKRAKFVKVVGTITLASILYELGMDDDEDYKNLPDYVKETYWAVRLPGDKERWFLIPKPFEVGAIASIGQRMTQMFIDESASPAFFADRVFNILRDQLAFDWRFQAFKPILEVGLNYDEFRDQQIESEGWRASGKLKHKRFRQNSSELAKAASAFLADYQPGDTALSPVQIDHLIRGYFGWLGMTIAGWGDIVLGDDAPEPTARFGDSKPGVMNLWGVAPVSSFYKEGPLKGNAQVNVFWEQYKDMQTLWQEYKGFVETNGADGELEEWLAENGKTIEWRRAYENMRKHMGNIGKATTAVYDDLEMTPDQKRKKIDEYIELRNKSAEGLVKMRQEYERSQKSGSVISDARADASVEDDYDVAAVQKALYASQYGPKEKTVADRLYESVNAAEFRGLSRFGSHFIRTRHAPVGGSSAYGPLQITLGLMRLAKDDLKLTKAESAYVKKFIKQGELFLKYGNEPDREGYQDKYDYGGKGDLSGSADRKLYEQVGKKLLALVWQQSNKDPQAFLNSWRFGGEKDVEKQDRRYFVAFQDKFKD